MGTYEVPGLHLYPVRQGYAMLRCRPAWRGPKSKRNCSVLIGRSGEARIKAELCCLDPAKRRRCRGQAGRLPADARTVEARSKRNCFVLI